MEGCFWIDKRHSKKAIADVLDKEVFLKNVYLNEKCKKSKNFVMLKRE